MPRRTALSGTWIVWTAVAVMSWLACLPGPKFAWGQPRVFRAGAAAVDISPKHFPAIISGMFLSREANGLTDPLFARALVLDDGTTKLALVVVDTLMMPRELIDHAKTQAAKATGIPVEHMLVSATHTHSAPSVMGALGTGIDEHYVKLLPGWIAEAIQRAAQNLAPARIGWAVTSAPEHTHCRRWIKRPDRIGQDPFGESTIRAMMHPGYQNPDYLGPAGPSDPELTLLAVQSPDGQPIALVANYSMHYFGSTPVSADYFGKFSAIMARLIAPQSSARAPVVMMSQGTAGDQHWMDYSQAQKKITLEAYSEQLAQIALAAYQKIRYQDGVALAAAERKLMLSRRVPDEKRLAWARQVIGTMKDPNRPTNLPEVYALEQFFLHKEPKRELKLQAFRIGPVGIAAMPAEVFAITGLKIKAQSPLVPTFNVELANGADGYIPPPEQHRLGGYVTWPARTAGLEVEAEPKIVETILQLLEQVSGKPRRRPALPSGPYQAAVLGAKPVALWHLDELAGLRAEDASGAGHAGQYEGGVAFGLEGADRPGLAAPGQVNRAPQFAGGWMQADLPRLGDTYSVEFWFWNALRNDARPWTGCLFARRRDRTVGSSGDHLAVGGTATSPGRLVFLSGGEHSQVFTGKTTIPARTWNHVVLVRDGSRVSVYLNGNRTPEIAAQMPPTFGPEAKTIFFGAASGDLANLEGKLDEAAVYERALLADEIAAHYSAAHGGQ